MRKKTVKRAFAALMAASVMMLSSVPALAEGTSDMQQSKSMELFIQKQPTYTMTIPKTTNIIAFAKEKTVIGDLYVTGDVGTKQQVWVAVEKTDFVDEKDDTNSFPFDLQYAGEAFPGAVWSSAQLREKEATAYELTVYIPTETWAETKAGTYKASLTFKAELQDVQ